MEKFKSFYNQNRKSILIFIGFVIFLFLLLISLNSGSGKNNNTGSNNSRSSNRITENTYSDINVDKEESAITGKNLSSKQIKSDLQIINDFVSYCNNERLDEAYELLSDDCKEEVFSDIDDFKENYYNIIFNGKQKETKVENWIDNIYKVNIKESALSTGRDDEESVEDYITILENGKLNINQYIGKTQIGKKTKSNGVTIIVNSKNVYMDYEEYDIEVINDNQNDILLDSKRDVESMYILDSNNVKYTAYTNEIPDSRLIVYKNDKRNLRIKYYSRFTTSKKIERVVFSDIILDYTDQNLSKKNVYKMEVAI